MRILMHTRPDWREHPGGDVVQLRRWAFWLRRAGVEVILSAEREPDLTGVDLVHLNNAARAATLAPTLEYCRRRGVPTALTTLYWPDDEYERYGRPGLSGMVFALLTVAVGALLENGASLAP